MLAQAVSEAPSVPGDYLFFGPPNLRRPLLSLLAGTGDRLLGELQQLVETSEA